MNKFQYVYRAVDSFHILYFRPVPFVPSLSSPPPREMISHPDRAAGNGSHRSVVTCVYIGGRWWMVVGDYSPLSGNELVHTLPYKYLTSSSVGDFDSLFLCWSTSSSTSHILLRFPLSCCDMDIMLYNSSFPKRTTGTQPPRATRPKNQQHLFLRPPAPKKRPQIEMHHDHPFSQNKSRGMGGSGSVLVYPLVYFAITMCERKKNLRRQ